MAETWEPGGESIFMSAIGMSTGQTRWRDGGGKDVEKRSEGEMLEVDRESRREREIRVGQRKGPRAGQRLAGGRSFVNAVRNRNWNSRMARVHNQHHPDEGESSVRLLDSHPFHACPLE